MLRVSLSDIKPIINPKSKNKKIVNTAKIAESATNVTKKVVPSLVMLANGTCIMMASNNNTKKTNYEYCSDFCCEIQG